jgi:hypothetical protein
VTVRLWLGVAALTLVLSPLAAFLWLMRSVGKAIERMNP